MKILQIISYFFPAWSYGGPGKLVYEIAREIGKNNTVSVITTDAFDADRRRNAEDEKNVSRNFQLLYYPNVSNKIAYNLKIFLPLLNFFQIRKDVISSDIIHIHEFFTPLAVIISFLAKYFQIPYVISAHGTLEAYRLKHRGIAKKVFMLLFGDRMIKNTAHFIALTKEESWDYQALEIKESLISVIPNGITPNEYNSLLKKSDIFRKRFGIEENTQVILYVGRIHHLKGLGILIQAFKEIVKKEKETLLLIVGPDDGYIEVLRGMIVQNKLENKVIFTGLLSGKEKTEAYANSDIFVYPSPSEGHSMAILEAAAAGLPLVITTGCRFNEVKIHQAGIVVGVNSKEITAAIIRLLENKVLRKQMGENARKMIKDNYSMKKMIIGLYGIYNRICKQQR